MGAVLAVWRSGPDSPHIVIGKLDDFPVGSITPLDVEAKVTGYVAVVSENSGSQVVDVSIFLVNDPAAGFLALYARTKGAESALHRSFRQTPDGSCRPRWSFSTRVTEKSTTAWAGISVGRRRVASTDSLSS